MKKEKILGLSLTAVIALGILSGCGTKEAPKTTPATTAAATTAAPTKAPDTATTASIVKDAAAFEKAIAKDGRWIIATLNDLKIDKDLVVEGDFKNGKKDDKGNEIFQRKIGLYTQDDKRNVTARFTLTAPKITFKSINGSIEHGTFVGDVYVEGKNFKLVDQKIQGNLYFASEEVKSTFKMDDKSSVTGKQEVKK
ncbi:MAG: hypothetical protein K0R31_1756 [Clostridiales bacterium]|jgi:hypothetical protein|nr:hypothetical protein [Clostridiales bacterium]